jgi:drug/metabolite transporter (DMT)-like permease
MLRGVGLTWRWLIGLLCAVLGGVLISGYTFAGWLPGINHRSGVWIGVAIGLFGLFLLVDTFRQGRTRGSYGITGDYAHRKGPSTRRRRGKPRKPAKQAHTRRR